MGSLAVGQAQLPTGQRPPLVTVELCALADAWTSLVTHHLPMATIYDWMVSYGIPRRGSGEGVKGAYAKGRRKPTVPRQTREERFWSYVDKSDECWLWTKYVNPSGYGTFNVGGIPRLAHRVAWESVKGPIPAGLSVCHNCPGGDNPACVRPDHMFLGTQDDNSKDAAKKGRMHPGEKHGMAKVTKELVRQIRSLHAGGMTTTAIGRQLGISRQSVGDVVFGRTWRHVE